VFGIPEYAGYFGQSERLAAIPGAIKALDVELELDVIAFQETFCADSVGSFHGLVCGVMQYDAEIMFHELKSQGFEYQTTNVSYDTQFNNWFVNGGVSIVSKHPIVETQY